MQTRKTSAQWAHALGYWGIPKEGRYQPLSVKEAYHGITQEDPGHRGHRS
jgi:hypothetical protein